MREFMAYDPAFTGGVNLAAGAFVNTHFPANSRVEIVTGAGEGGGPHVKVFNAGTGAELQSFMAFDPGSRGGVHLAVGLGIGTPPDIITAAGPGGAPLVKVFDGVSLALKQSFLAYDPGFNGGVSVAVGDVNRDGFADVVAGAGPGGGPHVKAFDARTGAPLRSFFAYDRGFAGGVRVATADINADGAADLLTGPGPGGGPDVRGFEGQTLTRLDEYFAYDPAFTGGVFVGGST
jgi:hypothetical protein